MKNKNGIPLSNRVHQTKIKPQVNKQQMAKHTRVDSGDCEASKGESVFSHVVHRNRCKRRAERLLKVWEKVMIIGE